VSVGAAVAAGAVASIRTPAAAAMIPASRFILVIYFPLLESVFFQ
jgi:hypothetical protein